MVYLQHGKLELLRRNDSSKWSRCNKYGHNLPFCSYGYGCVNDGQKNVFGEHYDAIVNLTFDCLDTKCQHYTISSY